MFVNLIRIEACHEICILRSLTYLHCCNPSSQSVAGLQQLEVSEPILGEGTGGGEAGDAAADDDELVVVVQVRGLVLLRHDQNLCLRVSEERDECIIVSRATADGN